MGGEGKRNPEAFPLPDWDDLKPRDKDYYDCIDLDVEEELREQARANRKQGGSDDYWPES